jgi:para-nitrobenzyl esterase
VTATPSNQTPTSAFTKAVVAASATAENQYPIVNFHNFVPQPANTLGLTNNFPSTGNADEALSQIFTDFVFACNGFDSNSDLSKQVPVFAYEFNDPNAPPGVNGSGFTTASQHAAELAYIFNFGAPFTPAQAALAAQMKTYWANFVKTRNPNNDGNLVVLASHGAQLPFWKHFNTDDFQVQSLTPAGLANPQGPHTITTFSTDHFCGTWEPLLTFDNGNEPQQP